jgi:hypothetical protein
MPTKITQPSLAGFNPRKSDQSARDARRDEINAIEEEFNSPEFVKINDSAYRKSELTKVTFGDTFIYARFSTGDIIEVTGEQLRALTS